MRRVASLLFIASVGACSLINKPEDVKPGPGENGHCIKVSDCTMIEGDACNDVACQNETCVLVPKNEGKSCDDGKFCTENDVCTNGTCGGTEKTCADPDVCHTGKCDEASQGCVGVPGHEGTACNDHNLCHGEGSCTAGSCVAADICQNLANECQNARCGSPEAGCETIPISEGLPCDVTNTCATSVCAIGVCTQMTAVTDGTICDDGKWCTVDERCKSGVCTPSTTSSICPVNQNCGAWTCDEANHTCTATNDNDGMSCSFGSCSTNGTCTGGTCNTTPTETRYFFDDFSQGNVQGWSMTGDWQIGPAVRSSGGTLADDVTGELFSPDPDEDHTPQTFDNMLAGVNLGMADANGFGGFGNGDTSAHGYYYLTTPFIDTSTASDVSLSFYRWLNSDYTPFMDDSIEVSTDGVNFTSLFHNQPMTLISDSHWTFETFDLTAYRSATTQVRFGYASNGSAFTVGSWNIDDVLVADTSCP